MNTYVLDTNIISLLLRRDPNVEARIEKVFASDDVVVLSPLAFYESKRGLLKRDAKKQLPFFEEWSAQLVWQDLVRADWELAAEMWAMREKQGRPAEDADLLIAAQAKRLHAILVTDNTKDFDGLNVTIENWREGK